jgi:5-methylcytosine-specific restriction endonuclease McrA
VSVKTDPMAIATALTRNRAIDFPSGQVTLSYWLFNPQAKVSPRRSIMIATDFAGLRCSYCWVPLTSKNCEREHVIPVSMGGIDQYNVVPVCGNCNRNRSNKSILFFFMDSMKKERYSKRRKGGGPYWKPEHSIHFNKGEATQ